MKNIKNIVDALKWLLSDEAQVGYYNHSVEEKKELRCFIASVARGDYSNIDPEYLQEVKQALKMVLLGTELPEFHDQAAMKYMLDLNEFALETSPEEREITARWDMILDGTHDQDYLDGDCV